MAKVIECEVCESPATYSIHPDGGIMSFWCSKHYAETVKELES